MNFALRDPVDDVFRSYVDMCFSVSGFPVAPEVGVGERCSRCEVGTKTKSSKGVDVCANCNRLWRGRVSAFFDGSVGARPTVSENRFITKLQPWREVKALVEPLPEGFELWFWCLCLTTTFAYVERGIGTVANVVEWGRLYRPGIRWTTGFVRESIEIARAEVVARQLAQSGRVRYSKMSDGWLGPVEGARLLGFADPVGAGRRRALKMLESGEVPIVENRSAGDSRKRLMAPMSAWLCCVQLAS